MAAHNVMLVARQAISDASSEQDEIAKYMMQFANYAYPNDAAQVIILMEAIRTIPAEIRMYRRAIRRKRLNAAESLFLLIKYMAILAWTCNALIENSSFLPNLLACQVIHNMFYYCMFLDVFLVAVAISWRTYVIFQCSRKAYWILCAALATHLSMSLFSAYRQHKSGTMIGGFCSVLPYDPIRMSHLSVPYFLAFNVAFDAIITAASSYRLISASKNLNGLSRISRILFHNNVHYAAIVCTVNFAEFIYMVTGDYKRRSLLNISCALQIIACLNLLINEQDVVHDAAPAYISRSRTMASDPGASTGYDRSGGLASHSRKSDFDSMERGKLCEKDEGRAQRVGGVKCVIEQHSLADGDIELGAKHKSNTRHAKYDSWASTPTSGSVLILGDGRTTGNLALTPNTASDDTPTKMASSPLTSSSATSLSFPVRLPSYEDLREHSAVQSNVTRPSTGVSIKSIRESMVASSTQQHVQANNANVSESKQQMAKLSKVSESPSLPAANGTDGDMQDAPFPSSERPRSRAPSSGASTFGGGGNHRAASAAHCNPHCAAGEVDGDDDTTEDIDDSSDSAISDFAHRTRSMRHAARSSIDGISSPALCHLWQSKSGLENNHQRGVESSSSTSRTRPGQRARPRSNSLLNDTFRDDSDTSVRSNSTTRSPKTRSRAAA